MNVKNCALWADALESGLYQQGVNHMVREYPSGEKEWCCLGVLQDVAEKNGVEFNWVRGKTNYLPDQVQEWAGLTRDQCFFLSRKNDGYERIQASFSEIAKLIREQQVPEKIESH